MIETSVVDYHRIPSGGLVVDRIEGSVVRVLDEGRRHTTLAAGGVLSVGDTIAVDAGAKVVASEHVFLGGAHGRSHAFVGDDAFQAKPGRGDVPEIVAQLKRMQQLPTGDPFRDQTGPRTPYQRAAAAEFARLNLEVRTGLQLSEETARSLRAVPLFLSDETAFVAMDSVDSTRVMALMLELSRPVSPHMVDRETLDALLERVFA